MTERTNEIIARKGIANGNVSREELIVDSEKSREAANAYLLEKREQYATVLSIPGNTVSKQEYRAAEALRRAMEETPAPEGYQPSEDLKSVVDEHIKDVLDRVKSGSLEDKPVDLETINKIASEKIDTSRILDHMVTKGKIHS